MPILGCDHCKAGFDTDSPYHRTVGADGVVKSFCSQDCWLAEKADKIVPAPEVKRERPGIYQCGTPFLTNGNALFCDKCSGLIPAGGVQFKIKAADQFHFCSKECATEAMISPAPADPKPADPRKRCITCDGPITNPVNVYRDKEIIGEACGLACAEKWTVKVQPPGKPDPVRCRVCRKNMEDCIIWAREGDGLFCSRQCHEKKPVPEPIRVDEVKQGPWEAERGSHYRTGEIECIDGIRAALTPEEYRGFLKGNILKYIWRERHKAGPKDVLKAGDYLEWLKDAK